jgi:hypothetical protein
VAIMFVVFVCKMTQMSVPGALMSGLCPFFLLSRSTHNNLSGSGFMYSDSTLAMHLLWRVYFTIDTPLDTNEPLT